MNGKWFLAAALAAGICGCASMKGQESKTSAPSDKTANSDAQVDATEVKVKLEETPPAVQKVVQEQMAGGELEDIAKQTHNGRTVYEVDMFRKEGGKRELRVYEDGTVLSNTVEK